ncbi:MAG: hypothetical protein R6V05_02380, partial [Candidatus Brocadiia bacterium]
MTVTLAVLLATAGLLCASICAMDQDTLRELVQFSREEVLDAHAFAEDKAPPPAQGGPTSETDGWLRKQLELFPVSELD